MKLFHLLDTDNNKVYEVSANNWIDAIFKVTATYGDIDLQVIAEQ